MFANDTYLHQSNGPEAEFVFEVARLIGHSSLRLGCMTKPVESGRRDGSGTVEVLDRFRGVDCDVMSIGQQPECDPIERLVD